MRNFHGMKTQPIKKLLPKCAKDHYIVVLYMLAGNCMFGPLKLDMKKTLTAFVLFAVATLPLAAQDSKPYTTSSGELIFSASTFDGDGAIRFSPVINVQNLINFDKSESFGWFTGLNVRNVGFIYDESATVRKKVRTYNVGIPLGVKVGNLGGRFIYFGYELEIPVNYKEKTFVSEDKEDKFNTWFSKRTPTFTHSLMVGLQLPYGSNIKFKYYLTPFYDQDFEGVDSGGNPIVLPDVNVFYVSLNFALFKNDEFYYSNKD